MNQANGSVDTDNFGKDSRPLCKFGAKCYRKNPIHHQKYKHPLETLPIKRDKTKTPSPPRKKFKCDDSTTTSASCSYSKQLEDCKVNSTNFIDPKLETDKTVNMTAEPLANSDNSLNLPAPNSIQTTTSLEPKQFIKQKFLVDMPDDFYQFWEFCKELNETCPQEAFKSVGLMLVGPYDVLAGKFEGVPEQPDENYLLHWRYFYDPPEFQTVVKGDDRTGLHFGYFRDCPNEAPVFLAKNSEQINGRFEVIGDNIFAAVKLCLDDLQSDPFKKMAIVKLQNLIKNKTQELGMELAQKTDKITKRDYKIVSRSFNKLGIVVPFNRKTKVGYRSLSVTNKELEKLLDKIKKALPEQKPKFISDLQPVLTDALIATDECDFGTGIELGLDILANGIDDLNRTISNYLASNYRLLKREAFAKIIESHMKNRKKGTKNLSII